MSVVKLGIEWTQDEIETLRSLVESGIAPSKLPTILGRSEGSIRARASRSKISLQYVRKGWEDLMPRLIALQAKGYSYDEIAEIVQRSPHAVRGAFYRYRKKLKFKATRQASLRERVEGVLRVYIVSDEALSSATDGLLALVAEVSGVTDGAVNLKDV